MGFASYEERLINLARTYLAILKNMPFHPQGQPYQPYEKPNARLHLLLEAVRCKPLLGKVWHRGTPYNPACFPPNTTGRLARQNQLIA